MRPRSRNLKFKGKYCVSIIRKFHFAVPSCKRGILLIQQVGDLTQYICFRWFSANCLCKKHHITFSSAGLCLSVKIIFERSHYESIKHLYHVHIPDATVPKMSTRTRKVNVSKFLRTCLNGMSIIINRLAHNFNIRYNYVV